MSTKKKSTRRSGQTVISLVLDHSAPRPSPTSLQGAKINYASRFADQMAVEIAADLARFLPGIDATTKKNSPSSRGAKQLDVNFSTPRLGLALGISLKSVHVREKDEGRYTHNLKRNDEELATEAAVYHERQPYAVMLAVMFLPFDSCTDAKTERTASSFGSWVKRLRMRAGRADVDGRPSQFEKIYIALYEPDGSDIRFFDVDSAPPRNAVPRLEGALVGADGLPERLLTYEEFVEAAYQQYQRRNHTEFRWDDGQVEVLSPDEE